MMNMLDYAFLAVSSLFVIVDPMGAAPTFLAITAENTAEQRIRFLKLACGITAVLLILFAITGKWIFLMLGITLPAFQIAGGLVLLLIAYDMLHTHRSALQETAEEKEEGIRKDDIAVTPLAIPMLAGPGAISTVILLEHRSVNVAQSFILYGSILVVCLLTYWILRIVAKGGALLGPITSKVISRLMGLFLAAVAVQFVVNGVSSL
jgi:multiple antibiotic resistance protein